MRTEKKAININFILYLLGRMVSDTGASIQIMIMPLYIIDIGGSAATLMLPKLVNQDELTRSNSIVSSFKSVSFMLGPVLGSILYSNFGITLIFLVNGISFLLSAISETKIRYDHVKREIRVGISGIFSDLFEGYNYIIKDKIIRKLSYFFLVVYLVVQPIIGVVLPLFYKTVLKYSDAQYGYLQSFSIANMFISVPIQSYIQRETPDEYMSRVFSLISMISKAGMPIGALIYGVVLNNLELHWTVLGMTLLMVMISIIFLISLLRTHDY